MLHTNERDRVKVEELYDRFSNIDADKEFPPKINPNLNNSIKYI